MTRRPLRVLHVVPASFGPLGVVGGGERYALELARHVAELTPTRLVAFGDAPRRETVGALDVRVHGPAHYVRGHRFNPVHPALLADVAWADVVHCHQWHVLASSLAAAAARVLRKRTFVTDLGGGGWDVSAYVDTTRWFHGHLHISRYSRHVFGQDALPRAHVILGGVDTERFRPAPPGAGPTERPVLFVGRLLPHKGVHDLVDALPEGLALDLVGPAPHADYRRELERRAQGKRVRFLGPLDEPGLVAAYQGALCVVLPSVYRDFYGQESRVPELLGQTLLEGMACGVPAVCTDVASMPEVVEDGVSGFVVPPNAPRALGAALARLAAEPALGERLGAAGRARVLSRFRWEDVAARCLAHYRGETPPEP